MPSTPTLLAFAAATVLLVVIPGPNLLYIVGTGIGSGRRIAVASALGVEVGTLVHITASALGLSALLSATPVAFMVVRYLGVAYLVYLAIVAFRSTPGVNHSAHHAALPFGRAFRRGVVVNVLNPKVSLFFLAFLPQFVEPDAPSKALAFLFLGAIFNINGTLWNLFVAWSAARISGGLRRSAAFTKWFNRCVGAVFIYLGISLALAEKG